MKKWWSRIRNESGQVLPLVMVALAVGSLLIVPSLNYVWTHVTAGVKLEENVDALYAADAGIEDAIWHLKTNPPAQWDLDKWSTQGFTLSNFNGMNVHTVITNSYYVSGEIPNTNHQEWLIIEDSYTYDSGSYTYSLSITNTHPKNMNVSWMRIDIPAGLTYVEGSLSGNMTAIEPTQIGSVLCWGEIGGSAAIFRFDGNSKGNITYVMELELEGTVEGDLNTNVMMWIKDELKLYTDAWLFMITATASDSSGEEHITITAGVSYLTGLDPEVNIRSWQITS